MKMSKRRRKIKIEFQLSNAYNNRVSVIHLMDTYSRKYSIAIRLQSWL